MLKYAFPVLMLQLGHCMTLREEEYRQVLKSLALVGSVAVITTGGLTQQVLPPLAATGRQVLMGWAFADYCAVMACVLLVCSYVFKEPRYRAVYL